MASPAAVCATTPVNPSSRASALDFTGANPRSRAGALDGTQGGGFCD